MKMPENLTADEQALWNSFWDENSAVHSAARGLLMTISRERERAEDAEADAASERRWADDYKREWDRAKAQWLTLDALQKGLALNRDEYMERARRAEAAIQAALRPFGYRFMDPPDGGGVEIEEQLLRMSQQHVSILAEMDRLRAVLAQVRKALTEECAITQPHEYCPLCSPRGPLAAIDAVLKTRDNLHRGSSFDSWLDEEGIRDEVEKAVKEKP